jgi:hypothetical protein
MTRARNNRGSITALSAALAMVLVVLGVGFFFFVMYMDAQKETKNAVDAGTLNAGRKALDEISVVINPLSCFFDVTNDKTDNTFAGCDGKINLRRVNRMWAEAMLFKINAIAAGSGAGNANTALNQATNISNQLADKLKNESNRHPFFTELAQQNSVRMIGNGAAVTVIPGNGWQTSKMLPEQESNIVVGGDEGNNFLAPPGFTWNGDLLTKTTRKPVPPNSNNLVFLKGYKALGLDGANYWQVPFLYDEKPHMVSKTDFDKATNNAAGWANPVPNAFSAEGLASAPGKPAEKATSWMLTNPRQPFKMSIPHSFVHIKIEQPKASIFFFPLGFPVRLKDVNYGFFPQPESASMPFGGPGCSNVTANLIPLAADTAGRSVDELIFDYPVGNKANLELNLVARCNEMIGQIGNTIDKQEMHGALNNDLNRGLLVAGLRDFYVYSPDGKEIHCNAAPIAFAECPWLAAASANPPDGIENKTINDAKGVGYFLPSIPTPLPFFTPLPFPVSNYHGIFHKTVTWNPGTGFNHCLGEVRVERTTDVNVIGVSVFP